MPLWVCQLHLLEHIITQYGCISLLHFLNTLLPELDLSVPELFDPSTVSKPAIIHQMHVLSTNLYYRTVKQKNYFRVMYSIYLHSLEGPRCTLSCWNNYSSCRLVSLEAKHQNWTHLTSLKIVHALHTQETCNHCITQQTHISGRRSWNQE